MLCYGCFGSGPLAPRTIPQKQQWVEVKCSGRLDFPFGENLIFPHLATAAARDRDHLAFPIVGGLGLGQCLQPLG